MKTDLEAMQIMSHEDKDIMAFPDITNVDAKKKVGKITFAISPGIAQQIMKGMLTGSGKYAAVLYVVNLEELKEVKSR